MEKIQWGSVDDLQLLWYFLNDQDITYLSFKILCFLICDGSVSHVEGEATDEKNLLVFNSRTAKAFN